MVHISIAGEDRDLRDVSLGWLRASIEMRRRSGTPVCIKVIITSGPIDMILATPDCAVSESHDTRPFRGEEIRIFQEWQAKQLDNPNFSVANLEDFLKSLRKFQ